MATVKLLSWHDNLAAKAAMLERAKLAVDAVPLVRTSAVVGEMARLNPEALVLDLDRLPSNSREIALMLRASKSARHIPILLAGCLPAEDGVPEKYARLRSELPDLPYAEWKDAAKALATLLKEPRTSPSIVPQERVYTASLAQKLGILSSSRKAASKPRQVALLGAPEGFIETLGDLPDTVTFVPRIAKATDLAMCFVRTAAELAAALDMVTLRMVQGASVWIAYPKRGEFNNDFVREAGLAAGLVDYKVCSIDAAWSALKFAWRKPSA